MNFAHSEKRNAPTAGTRRGVWFEVNPEKEHIEMDTSTCIPEPEGRGFDLSLVSGSAKRPVVTIVGVIRNVKADIDSLLDELLIRLECLVEEGAAQQPEDQAAEHTICIEYGRDGKHDAELRIFDPRRMLANMIRWENWLMTALVKLWQAFDAHGGKTFGVAA